VSKGKMKMNEFIYLYGLNIQNDGYLDSVHLEYDAFRFSKTDEDTIIEMLVPMSVANKLFEDDFSDGYERYNFVSEYINH
jgi:hypothetical protein